ncbi:MAG: hypothetical protein NT099_08710 [Candidatus Saganbacteria bacterium]|nr:hypothetical protein [Candidatus Saganbacteria bacterium]
MGKALKVLLGIVLLVLGVASIWYWRWDVLLLIRGSIGFVAIMVGLLFFALASD